MTQAISGIFLSYYKRVSDFIYTSGQLLHLLKQIMVASFTSPFYFKRLFEQIVVLGAGSLSITIVIGITVGFVMTLNFGYGLAKFGGTLYVPAVVALSIFREMAPVFTSLLVAGRIGSGMAAEIGSMNVTQQIDALRALGTSPVRVLVVPRFWASIISLPLLISLSGVLSILAGMLICSHDFDIPYSLYMNKVITAVKLEDYLSGLVKGVIFSAIITLVGCYKGLSTADGTRGVGKSTTWVVVTSSILILISDFFISKIFLVIWVTS
jgi:phospholipid/cholesterol/gamma-HCH transport system permease protein